MRTQTVVTVSAFLVIVNIGLFITIYNLMNPDNRLLVDSLDFKKELVVSKEEDIEKVEAKTVESPDESNAFVNEDITFVEEPKITDEIENLYTISEWNLSFQLVENPSKYEIIVKRDLVTIKKHLQDYAYILRYDEGVEPSIEGEWDALGIFDGKSYYLRHGTSIVDAKEALIDEERQKLYDLILQTHFFEQQQEDD